MIPNLARSSHLNIEVKISLILVLLKTQRNRFRLLKCFAQTIQIEQNHSAMDIQESSLPSFYCSRVLGLAPYLIRRNSKDRIDEIRRSSWLCFYSLCFLAVTGLQNTAAKMKINLQIH